MIRSHTAVLQPILLHIWLLHQAFRMNEEIPQCNACRNKILLSLRLMKIKGHSAHLRHFPRIILLTNGKRPIASPTCMYLQWQEGHFSALSDCTHSSRTIWQDHQAQILRSYFRSTSASDSYPDSQIGWYLAFISHPTEIKPERSVSSQHQTEMT